MHTPNMHTPNDTLRAAGQWFLQHVEHLHGPKHTWTPQQRLDFEALGGFLFLFLLEVPLTLIPTQNAKILPTREGEGATKANDDE